jgi:hypothetical protein
LSRHLLSVTGVWLGAIPCRCERAYIEAWLAASLTCPVTGQQLQPPVPLGPNHALRAFIAKWAELELGGARQHQVISQLIQLQGNGAC